MNSHSPFARLGRSVRALPALLAAALLVPAVADAAETVTVPAREDSYVSSGFPSTNYGTGTEFGIDGSPVEIGYLKFDLSAYAGRPLQSTTLQLRSGSSGSTGTQNIKLVADDAWSEATVTYGNRPALGAGIGRIGPTSTNTNYTVALTTTGVASELGGILSLGMDSTSTDGLNVTSSETTTGPRLVLTFSDGGSADTTAPTVTSVNPAGGATGVAATANVTATLSEALDPASVSNATVSLADATGSPVSATVTYDAAAQRVVLDPGADLAAGATYTATVKGGTSGVKDAAGNALAADRVWSFTTQAAASGTSTVTVPVSEDAYVSSGFPGTNYGSSTVLGIDGSPIEITYFKFDLSPYAGRTLQSASLQVRSGGSGSTGRQNVKLVADDSWTQSGLTYNSRPALGSSVGSVGPTSTNTSYTIALTAAGVAPDLGGRLSLALDSTSTDGLDLNSRETTTGPRLVLTFGDGTTTPTDPVIAAAGDIACDPNSVDYNGGAGTATACRQKWTSDLLIGQGFAKVLTLGDHQYEDDQYAKYLKVFDPTWGRVKDLIRPVVGNREYRTPGAAGYFDYFNGVGQQAGAAGDRTKGYYSYDVGAWHIIALNSNCSQVGGCGSGTPQHNWLKADLAANPTTCTLAYLHHPRFTSGSAGNDTTVQPLWQALYDARADVILASHAHGYERFARQTPTGTADSTRGLRQFVVGTGGKSLQSFATTAPNTEVRNNNTYGILKLALRNTSYDWKFVPEAGKTFTDSGSTACH